MPLLGKLKIKLAPFFRNKVVRFTGLFFPVMILWLLTHSQISGAYEGIYLVKDASESYVFKDDLFSDEYNSLIYKFEFEPFFEIFESKPSKDTYLKYEWNKELGWGFVRNFFPGGKKMITVFGRNKNTDGKTTPGLFVGGGLPFSDNKDHHFTFDETGVAFFDGNFWDHIWCNANEAIFGGLNLQKFSINDWKYLSSDVIKASDEEVIFSSSHKIEVDGQPFLLTRYASFRAGEKYFILAMKITNMGMQGVNYYYQYGDEPWVGNFGSSDGDVGWVKDRIINFEENIDPQKYAYAGIFDHGNREIGEGSNFSNRANFIEWPGDTKPAAAAFTNSYKLSLDAPDNKKTPLNDPYTRSLVVIWGLKILPPGQSDTVIMAIGMADNDPKTGYPVKPEVTVPNEITGLLKNN